MLVVMFPIIYQVAVVHLDTLEMRLCCVKGNNKFKKTHVVFVVKMQYVESVKTEYQHAHAYQEWLEVHHHVDQNVYPVETVHYNRLVSTKNVKIRVLAHVEVSIVLMELFPCNFSNLIYEPKIIKVSVVHERKIK